MGKMKRILIYDPETEGYGLYNLIASSDNSLMAEAIDDYVYEDVEEAARELKQLERLLEGEAGDRGGV